MRIFAFTLLLLLTGCTSVQDLTRGSCLPEGVPGEVVTKRITYLYKHQRGYEVWDSLFQYGQGLDAAGKLIWHVEPPLRELPAGTHLELTKITRSTSFDGPANVIEATGTLVLDGERLPFRHVWGVGNQITRAPWETAAYDPRAFDRTISCK